jgi:hypothetical protein
MTLPVEFGRLALTDGSGPAFVASVLGEQDTVPPRSKRVSYAAFSLPSSAHCANAMQSDILAG